MYTKMNCLIRVLQYGVNQLYIPTRTESAANSPLVEGKNIEKCQSMITHAGRARFREVSTIILCLGNISKFRQVVTKEKHSHVEVRPYKYEVLFG